MKITRKKAISISIDILECIVAVAFYYFLYNVNPSHANSFAVICLSASALLKYKKKNKPDFLHKE